MVEDIVLYNESTNGKLELSCTKTEDFVLNYVDWGAVSGTHHSYKYVGQNGVYISGTSIGTRSVDIVGWVIAESEDEMTSRKSILNRFFSPQQMIRLEYKDYLIRFIPDKSVQYTATFADNNECICKFKVTGTCPDPLFANSYESRVSIAATVPVFHFPLILSDNLVHGGVIFGYRQNSLIALVNNKGTEETGMKIVFKAKGSVVNPQLFDVDTQKYIKINKTLIAGEQVVVNTNIGERNVQGALENESLHNYFKYKDLSSSWLQLRVGENLFRYNASSGLDNLEVFIYFNNKYLEVQEWN